VDEGFVSSFIASHKGMSEYQFVEMMTFRDWDEVTPSE
jgi:hypothetical protein